MPSSPLSSQRTCAGCSERGAPQGMLRLLFPVAGGELPSLELPGGLSRGPRPAGRGVHIHARQGCLDRAVKKGLARALRRQVRLPSGELSRLLREHLESSLSRALGAARRQKALRPGPTTGNPCLRIAAVAPSQGGTLTATRVFAGTKQQLGGLVEQPAADEIEIMHPGLAARVRTICELASGAGIGGLEVG